MKKSLLFTAAVLLAFAGSASAQVTIYDDQFGYGSVTPTPINGQMPDTVDTGGYGGTAGAVWSADLNWVANGTGAGSQASAGPPTFQADGYLPFVPESGQIYTLSASLSGGRDQDVFLGFTEYAAPGASWLTVPAQGQTNYPNPGPFIQFDSDSGNLYIYDGPASTNTPSNGPSVTESEGSSSNDTYTITLNTTTTAWTYSVTGPGFSTGPLAFTNGNPTISYVGIGDFSDANATFGNVDHFTLTVPEPSTYTLLGLGCLALFVVSRRRASRMV